VTDLERELSDALRDLRERFAVKLGTVHKLKNPWDVRAWNKACEALAKADAARDAASAKEPAA